LAMALSPTTCQEFVGAGFEERHFAPADPRQRRFCNVDYANSETGFCESQTKGQAHMAPATQDHNVKGNLRRFRGRAHRENIRGHSALNY
jgi:hypothetical protein